MRVFLNEGFLNEDFLNEGFLSEGFLSEGLVPERGLEPPTNCLRSNCSTN